MAQGVRREKRKDARQEALASNLADATSQRPARPSCRQLTAIVPEEIQDHLLGTVAAVGHVVGECGDHEHRISPLLASRRLDPILDDHCAAPGRARRPKQAFANRLAPPHPKVLR
jgi:hypothetical protein